MTCKVALPFLNRLRIVPRYIFLDIFCLGNPIPISPIGQYIEKRLAHWDLHGIRDKTTVFLNQAGFELKFSESNA